MSRKRKSKNRPRRPTRWPAQCGTRSVGGEGPWAGRLRPNPTPSAFAFARANKSSENRINLWSRNIQASSKSSETPIANLQAPTNNPGTQADLSNVMAQLALVENGSHAARDAA
ncbi:hypothetical protein PGQ11_000142 [Apiospora arundinis]